MKKISESIAAKFRRARLFKLESLQAVRDDGTEVGDLMFARIVPSLSGPEAPSLILTTPYILLNSKPEDWRAFFLRQGVDEAGLYRFFKYGPTEKYWHDYIMDGYVNFTSDRVYLTGIPDVPGSLPHAQ